MKRLVLLLLIVGLGWSLPALAAPLQVSQGEIAPQVVKRAPVDSAESFPASVGQLYCFTRIAGASGETTVTHVWYREGVEMARVTLPVRSGDWRTWSSKRVLPGWTGAWRVDVLDASGQELKSIPFTIK